MAWLQKQQPAVDDEDPLDRIVAEACKYLPLTIQESVKDSIEYGDYLYAGELQEGAVFWGEAEPREGIRTAILELKGEVSVPHSGSDVSKGLSKREKKYLQ